MFPEKKLGAVGKHNVVVLNEAFSSERKGGDEEDGTAAKAEEDQGPKPLGEVMEGAVKGKPEVVEVANERECRRRWGKGLAIRVGGPETEEVEEESTEEEG